jgi:hypothetical protein
MNKPENRSKHVARDYPSLSEQIKCAVNYRSAGDRTNIPVPEPGMNAQQMPISNALPFNWQWLFPRKLKGFSNIFDSISK